MQSRSITRIERNMQAATNDLDDDLVHELVILLGSNR